MNRSHVGYGQPDPGTRAAFERAGAEGVRQGMAAAMPVLLGLTLLALLLGKKR